MVELVTRNFWWLGAVREPLRGNHPLSYWIVPEAKIRSK